MKNKTIITKLEASKEFIVGKHNIGWINSNFNKEFGNSSFEVRGVPTFQKLPRNMNDASIESELMPGFCELGDILAFLDTAPEECKDGYTNLFYTQAFVVGVFWDEFNGSWRVGAWRRDGGGWRAGSRVFSPATAFSIPQNSVLETSDTLDLEKAIEVVKEAGYQVAKII